MKHLRGVTVESQVEGERSKLSHFLASVTPPSPIFLKLLPHLLHCTGPPTLLCSSVSSTSYSFFTLVPILRPTNPPTLIHTVPQNGLFLYYSSHLLCSDYLLLSNSAHFSPNIVPTLVHICPAFLSVVQNHPSFPISFAL